MDRNLCAKFMDWINIVLPGSLGIWDGTKVIIRSTKGLLTLYKAIALLDEDSDNEVKFIHAILAAEAVIELVRDSGMESPSTSLPIEGLEGLYHTMKVMNE